MNHRIVFTSSTKWKTDLLPPSLRGLIQDGTPIDLQIYLYKDVLAFASKDIEYRAKLIMGYYNIPPVLGEECSYKIVSKLNSDKVTVRVYLGKKVKAGICKNWLEWSMNRVNFFKTENDKKKFLNYIKSLKTEYHNLIKDLNM